MELRVQFEHDIKPVVFVVNPPVHQSVQTAYRQWLMSPTNGNRVGEFTAYVPAHPTETYTVVLNFETVSAIYHNQ